MGLWLRVILNRGPHCCLDSVGNERRALWIPMNKMCLRLTSVLFHLGSGRYLFRLGPDPVVG